jgi:peptidoglycan/LPS O-acetylase OafA/YrhL
VLLGPLFVKPALLNRPLEWLGVISYSVYVTHLPLLVFGLAAARAWRPDAVGAWNAPAAAVVGLVLVGCLSLSVLTYRAIERPFLVRKAQRRLR